MSDHPLTSLEAALCADPIYSDRLEFELRGITVAVRFREIAQDRIDRFRRTSIQWVEQDRNRKETGKEWRDVQMDLDAMRANELDLRMVHYAMIDADLYDKDSTIQSACSLQRLRDEMSPDVQEHLAAQHKVFRDMLSPDSMSPEDVAELAELIKKKAIPVHLLSMRFGFKTALVCLEFLADQLTACQTELSLVTPTGE